MVDYMNILLLNMTTKKEPFGRSPKGDKLKTYVFR